MKKYNFIIYDTGIIKVWMVMTETGIIRKSRKLYEIRLVKL